MENSQLTLMDLVVLSYGTVALIYLVAYALSGYN